MQLICVCLRGFAAQLPDVAVRALSTANAYWFENNGSAHDLDVEREACWGYLDAAGATTKLDNPEVLRIRAVICALYPRPQGADFDEETLRWFVMLLNKLGNYSDLFAEALSAR